MKQTLNINLAGYPFIIDEDAYKLLKDYLDTIRYAFETTEDTEDLATDIESRIAELLIEKENGNVRIMTLEEVSKVIERIGKPSEFIEIKEQENNSRQDSLNEEIEIEEKKITPPPYNSPNQNSRNPFARKKIFRDPQNALLGGVCAGLAAYMHIDVTVIRIITVLLFFLSASTVAIAYIILWIVVPEANTPLQRMQMTGEDPTVENIGKTVTENFQGDENQKSDDNNKSGTRKFITNVFSIFVKCIVILCFIIGFPVLLAILLVLLACIIAFFAAGGALIGGGIFGDSVNFSAPGGGVLAFYLLLASIGAIITLGIPFWLLIKVFFKKNSGNISSNNRRSIVIIWLIGIALTVVFTVKSVRKAKYLNTDNWNFNFEKFEELKNIESKDIENINLDKDNVTITTTDGQKYIISKGKVIMEARETLEEEETPDSVINETTLLEIENNKTDSIK